MLDDNKTEKWTVRVQIVPLHLSTLEVDRERAGDVSKGRRQRSADGVPTSLILPFYTATCLNRRVFEFRTTFHTTIVLNYYLYYTTSLLK